MVRALLFTMLMIIAGCSKKEDPEPAPLKKEANPFYEKAFLFSEDQHDSIFYYLNRAKDIYQKRNDSFGIGKSLLSMAIVQESAGDNFGSIETSLLASKYLKEKDSAHHNSIFSNYNNLGVASNNLRNYDVALEFYEKAAHFTNDPVDRMSLENNEAIVYHNEKKYEKAIAIYRTLLDSVGAKSEFYPKLLLNAARSKWFQNKNYNPVPAYKKAEKLSSQMDDDWTKDAAYAYLSSYYLEKNPDSAKIYARRMLGLARQLKYPTDELEALQHLIKLSEKEESQNYFEDYSRIQDSLIASQNKAKNQFALIRFESEKAKAENLKLQKERAVHELAVARQKIITWSILILSLFIGTIFFMWILRRRKRLILEAESGLQQQRLDFSKKVHDVVANGLYEVMSSIENENNLPKEKILSKLEMMYEKSRDLSYTESTDKAFYEKVSAMLASFQSSHTKIIIIGNDHHFWDTIAPEAQEELQQVLRELMVNMKKHSAATQVILRFSKEESLFSIHYADNGMGLSEDFMENNGFSNMRTRLAKISAAIEITERRSGLKILIKSIK